MSNATLGLKRLKDYQSWGDIWTRSGWRVQAHVGTGDCRVLDAGGVVVMAQDRQTCLEAARHHAPPVAGSRAVILLHSMAGSPRLLSVIARRLGAKGFETANIAYPSLEEDLGRHAARVEAIAAELARDGVEEISFVGHSLGGLVARAAAPHLPVPIGRIAFLGTPNAGSNLGRILHRLPPYGTFFGPGGRDVLADAVATLPIPQAPMLVVAGGNGWCGFNPLLRGDDDGIVTTAETRIASAHEYRRVLCLHRDLPRHKGAMKTVVDFLSREKLA